MSFVVRNWDINQHDHKDSFKIYIIMIDYELKAHLVLFGKVNDKVVFFFFFSDREGNRGKWVEISITKHNFHHCIESKSRKKRKSNLKYWQIVCLGNDFNLNELFLFWSNFSKFFSYSFLIFMQHCIEYKNSKTKNCILYILVESIIYIYI